MIDPLAFLGACLTLLIVPGPTNALMFAAGARRNGRKLAGLIVAILCAYALSISAAHLLLKPVLASFPLLAKGVRASIGLYVLWLAYTLWTSSDRRAAPPATAPAQIFLTTLLNPKGVVLAFVILPSANAQFGWYLAGLSLTILLCSAAWWAAGALLSQAAGTRLAPRLSAIALIIFGGLTLGSAFR